MLILLNSKLYSQLLFRFQSAIDWHTSYNYNRIRIQTKTKLFPEALLIFRSPKQHRKSLTSLNCASAATPKGFGKLFAALSPYFTIFYIKSIFFLLLLFHFPNWIVVAYFGTLPFYFLGEIPSLFPRQPPFSFPWIEVKLENFPTFKCFFRLAFDRRRVKRIESAESIQVISTKGFWDFRNQFEYLNLPCSSWLRPWTESVMLFYQMQHIESENLWKFTLQHETSGMEEVERTKFMIL